MKLGTWNVRSLYRAGSLKAAARELARYKLDVVGVQEVRWDKEGTVNRRERDHWGDLGADGWIILGWISRRWDVVMWTGLGWHRIGTGGGRL